MSRPWWWWVYPWLSLARRERAYADALDSLHETAQQVGRLRAENKRLRRVLARCEQITRDMVYHQSPETCVTVYDVLDDEIQDAMADARLALEREEE